MPRMTPSKLMIIEQSGFHVFFKGKAKRGNMFPEISFLVLSGPIILALKTQLKKHPLLSSGFKKSTRASTLNIFVLIYSCFFFTRVSTRLRLLDFELT